MKFNFRFLLFLSLFQIFYFVTAAQSREQILHRYNTYLNFRGSLNNTVKFTTEGFQIMNAGKPEISIYWDETELAAAIFQALGPEQQQAFYIWKKNKHLSQAQRDSLHKLLPPAKVHGPAPAQGPLSGYKIAIDPGHIAGDMDMARLEQKFLYFLPDSVSGRWKDTIAISEGVLTYKTALLLKQALEEKGAEVFVTRQGPGLSAFGLSYEDWYVQKRKLVFDSLLFNNLVTPKRYSQLVKEDRKQLFWDFFRDYELMERARRINSYRPDLSLIIHYNVDEKNTDWLKPSTKDFTMTFIGGGISSDNFSKPANKLHFMRLLLSQNLDQSEKLSALTVREFSKQLHIPIARPNDADYLRDNCLKTPSEGVYCRNLALCRTIASPVVYGECLYQDELQECQRLNQNDTLLLGMPVPSRIKTVADCYLQAVLNYVQKP